MTVAGIVDEIHAIIAPKKPKELPSEDPWNQMIFFLSPRESLSGRRPLDLILSGDVSNAVAAARRHQRHGATTEYAITQEWASALMTHPQAPAGIRYNSRKIPGESITLSSVLRPRNQRCA